MALDIFETFASDEIAEVEGVWVNLIAATDTEPESAILVARDGNTECEQLVEQLMARHADELIEDGPDRAALNRKIEIEVTARTILKGWKNLRYSKEPIDYSYENAVKLLQHKDFRNLVLFHARQRAAYMQKLEDTVAKN